ncbi:hypothetical protein H0H81_003262 [Sphagnurus paluster]|uniref:Uncharacterized protein n=1 Tax=Sphagnurus paluster TaxID=117069 RepID=A0A9P7GGH8_9AGAR|nr:hypothetical protein H0H81_003262 [Sphagnurus paluster]
MMAGRVYALHEDIPVSTLITIGLDLEEKQRSLAVNFSALGQHSTDRQQTTNQNRENALTRRIATWINIQHLYTPALAAVRARDEEQQDPEAEDNAHDIELYLPSHVRSIHIPVDRRLRQIEWDLREAQIKEALEGLRLCSYLYIDKDCQRISQIQNTCSRAIIARTQAKIDEAAATYRVARKALAGLTGPLGVVGWEGNFPVLLATDIKGLTDGDLLAMSTSCKHRNDECPSEGRRVLSWIWTKLGDLGQEADLLQHSMLQAHLICHLLTIDGKIYASSGAKCEEVLLLREEMNRVRRFFLNMARMWDSRSSTQFSIGRYDDSSTQAGRQAYALQQAVMYHAMDMHCCYMWRYVDSYVSIEGGTVIPQEIINAEQDDGDADATVAHNPSTTSAVLTEAASDLSSVSPVVLSTLPVPGPTSPTPLTASNSPTVAHPSTITYTTPSSPMPPVPSPTSPELSVPSPTSPVVLPTSPTLPTASSSAAVMHTASPSLLTPPVPSPTSAAPSIQSSTSPVVLLAMPVLSPASPTLLAASNGATITDTMNDSTSLHHIYGAGRLVTATFVQKNSHAQF